MFMSQFLYVEAKISPPLETRMLYLGKEDWYAKVIRVCMHNTLTIMLNGYLFIK